METRKPACLTAYTIVTLLAKLYTHLGADTKVMTTYPSSRPCKQAYTIEKCVMLMTDHTRYAQIESELSSSNLKKYVQHFPTRVVGVWCMDDDIDNTIKFHESIYNACSDEACKSWSWILSTLEMQKRNDWARRASIGVLFAIAYTTVVSYHRSPSGMLYLWKGVISVLLSVFATDVIYVCMGYDENMISDCAALVIAGTGFDAIIMNIKDSASGMSTPEIQFATFVSTITSGLTFFLLFFALKVGDAKGFFLKGSIGFLLCVVHRFLFLNQKVSVYRPVRTDSRSNSSRWVVFKVVGIMIALFLNLVALVNTSYPSVQYSFKEGYPIGSADYMFHNELENLRLELPFVMSCGSNETCNMNNRYGLKLVSTSHIDDETVQVFTLQHGLFLDDSMYQMINDLDQQIAPHGCLTCQLCDVVDTFNILLQTTPMIITLLLTILFVLSITFQVIVKGVMGVCALLMAQMTGFYYVTLMNGHLNLIDLMVMSCVPGIGIDYVVHLIFVSVDDIGFIRWSILHCFVTTCSCFFGLLASNFVLIRSIALSFTVSLTITFFQSICLSYLFDVWSGRETAKKMNEVKMVAVVP